MRHRSHRLMRILGAAGVVLMSTFVGLPSAHASNNGNWSVAPTGNNGNSPRDWFEYEFRAGQTLRDMVSVSNTTSAPMTFNIYPTDAYNTPLDGAFALLLRKDKPTDAGSWIHLGFTTLTVPARSRADLAFEISVPPDAAPGDHVAGIVAEDAQATTQPLGKGRGVDIKQRVATRVYIRVAGSLRPALTVTRLVVPHSSPLLPPFSGNGQAAIGYEITNTGNVRLTGTAVLKMKGLFGRTLKTFKPRSLPELLPKGTVVITEKWNGPLPIIDRVSAHVSVTAEGTSTLRTKGFWKIPWIEVAIILGVLLLLLGRRRYGRRNDQQPAPVEPEPSTPEAVLV